MKCSFFSEPSASAAESPTHTYAGFSRNDDWRGVKRSRDGSSVESISSALASRLSNFAGYRFNHGTDA